MVVFGVDPHKQTHTVVAVDETGRRLDQVTVKARGVGHLQLLQWAARIVGDGPCRWGVEDGKHLAGNLVRDLTGAGQQVVMVPPKLMAKCRDSARTRGKSDPIDALAVARAVLREPDLPTACLDAESLQVRLLVDHREDLVAERTRTINRLRWHLHQLDPDLAPPPRTLTRAKTLRTLADQLAVLPSSTRRDLALELVERIGCDTKRINQLERDLVERVHQLVPTLLRIPGVGALTAAKLVGEIASIDRFAGPAQLAMLAGAAPIPVWSSNTEKHRLNRGGNRQLNACLHRIAITQIRCHEPARTLYQRRRTRHADTKAGALRVLKRHLVDIVYKTLHADQHAADQPIPIAA
jgi:transposase